MNHIANKPSSSRVSPENNYQIPSHLLQPMWLRSRESLADNGLVYDPIAAMACRKCQLSSECLSGDIDQKQLLHATLTKLCDTRVNTFLENYPNAWVLNVGAGLDTRFYRLDNGLCHWIELDTSENLVWRQRLFHKNERYQLFCGSVKNMEWLETLPIPDNVPVLIVCEQALLDCTTKQIATFVQALSRYYVSAQACFVVAGDRSSSKLGTKLGCVEYQHGLLEPSRHFLNWLPWIQWIKSYSPLDEHCGRWKFWQKMVAKLPLLKNRYTPSLVELRW